MEVRECNTSECEAVTHSLAMQVSAIRHVVNDFAARSDPSDTILEAAMNGLKTLEFFNRRESLVREVDRLEKKHPELLAILTAFPGSEITDIRSTSHASGNKCLCPTCGSKYDRETTGRDRRIETEVGANREDQRLDAEAFEGFE